MRSLTLEIKDGMTDEEIKIIASKVMNGSYITKICKGCGDIWINEDGDLEKAVLIKECRKCVEIV